MIPLVLAKENGIALHLTYFLGLYCETIVALTLSMHWIMLLISVIAGYIVLSACLFLIE